MKTHITPPRTGLRTGLTLLEISVIILVILAITSMLFIGVQAWKRGSDRAACILNIRLSQLAVRSYANSNDLDPGVDTTLSSKPVNLPSELIGPGKYIPNPPTCPGGGLYTMGGNVIPQAGSLYLSCSLAGSNGHVPDEYGMW